MKTNRIIRALVAAAAATLVSPAAAQQCCLSGLFAGCGSCFHKPAYAVAPVMAPVAAPIAAPPPPVMVPVQQTSYVPETTYRTQMQSVPVTTYKPSCEIDPCTGCPVECMQPVTQYVQQAVNVPVTQYRAVTTTKYVQMQPGYAGQPTVGGPVAYPAGPALPGPATPAASPFATPAAQPAPAVQSAPQGWVPATGVQQQLVPPGQPSITPPALPTTGYYAPAQVVPQAGTYAPQTTVPGQPQPVTQPAPSLKPIPELPRTSTSGTAAPFAPAPATTGTNGTVPAPSLLPNSGTTAPGTNPTGTKPGYPKLLEPTSHTTSWQPAGDVAVPASVAPAYPTAALPTRLSR